jgi:ABC-type branched-subunit amino acid transport system substrate-binding protein
MSKTAKVWAGVVIIVAVILVIWAVQNAPKNSEKKVIKIGLVAPLTGGGAIFGNSFTKAIELAQRDLKDTKNEYKIIVEDDGTNPAQSAGAAQKLIHVDKVAAIISMTSGTGNAIKPIAFAAKIPHVCICSDITVANTDYNFTNLLLPDEEAGGWLDKARSRGVKTIAILHQNQAGINAIINSLKKLAPEYGVSITYEDQWDPTIRDLKTTIGKAKATKPDLFYLVAFPPSEDIAGQQLKEANITNISSSAGFGIATKPELFEGLWYNDGNVADIAFRTRFETEFPSIRFNVRSAPYGYDSFMMIVQGFESGQDITKYLTDLTSFDGEAGVVTKEAGKRNFHSQPGFWIVKNGKAEKFVE